ncbi:MAG TPA: hypothetical protein ENH31_02740 [Nitrospirae bacterium]|nr:Pilus assembly protein, PilO [bacterium BMS3Abin10]GBE38914.1 Pilus assembly protein, PilO [bacterium BMS3Bbin08]HDH50250.1 hypothetical protein [Nitrospirota bacterium]HDK16994.1 hypothetical protein [Nitrospirota bacterium]HDK41400.1 hypothetical protein [Nitrospirota bacterium]
MAIDLKSRNIPQFLKIIIIVVPAVVLVVLFLTVKYSPMNKEIKILEAGIAKLDNDIATAKVKVRKLDELRAEAERLKVLLVGLRQQMPEENEVSVLLKQISDLGLKSGLVILLWKPENKKPDPKGVYTEIPVKMEIVAGYHDLGVFFSYISRIKRIVNISNIKIQKAGGNYSDLIKASFTASTFSAVYDAAAEGSPTGAAVSR